ncbi:MAG: GNAT family N-acetyltransferase [Deltaproteobacteria bacterium]|nr:MAG: GNAT family N-acetyltransferase [Deltaproteobacteria bacterium]
MAENYLVETTAQSWELKIAAEAEVEPTLEQLTDHMNEQQRQAFRDKLQRYVNKPDRDLILAVRGPEVLGLVCVIKQAEFPPGLSEKNMDYLRDFACGTQLLVHPSFRRQGIGGSLLAQAEAWARERELAGFWITTHRMADWYEKNFGYKQIARVALKSAAKTIMAKKFD